MEKQFLNDMMVKAGKYAKDNEREFERFKTYCNNVGDKPYDANVLISFVNEVNRGNLVLCDVCDEYGKEEHMHTARYDIDKIVCEDCHNDGN